ncbi:hypothetical protein BC835DRAFT_1400707 [Cytidiella melzeri]|nr:hypothetical protein BC835DRAFT_1400707 [Cytidiella melzeri]
MRFSTSPVLLVALVAGTLSVVNGAAISQRSTGSPSQIGVSHQSDTERVYPSWYTNKGLKDLSHAAYGRIMSAVVKDIQKKRPTPNLHGHTPMRELVESIMRLNDDHPAKKALMDGVMVRWSDDNHHFYKIAGGKSVPLI